MNIFFFPCVRVWGRIIKGMHMPPISRTQYSNNNNNNHGGNNNSIIMVTTSILVDIDSSSFQILSVIINTMMEYVKSLTSSFKVENILGVSWVIRPTDSLFVQPIRYYSSNRFIHWFPNFT